MKIMIVDDHADIRRVLKKIINVGVTEPIEFIECDNGETAITEYASHHPEYVLMDVELKEMNGLEATKNIMTSDENAKVLIVTSHDSLSFRSKAEALKAYGFVSKDDLSVIPQYINVT
jgi:DNA-binding NarL/FixJ family response regulator